MIESDDQVNIFISEAERPTLSLQYVDRYGNEYPYILRVMSYNLAAIGHHPNWENRVEMLAREINLARPDVIGLQEIRFHPTYNASLIGSIINLIGKNKQKFERHMLNDLLELIPEYKFSHWQPGMRYKDGIIEGVAVVSRYPIIETEHVNLGKSPKDGNHRVCMRAFIGHPCHDFIFYNTHLTYSKKGQIPQATKVCEFMNKSSNKKIPQILTGDFNIRKSYKAPLSVFTSQDSLKDAWRSANSDEKGFTFPSWNPKERLDYILYRGLIVPCMCSISGYALNKDIWPSDHCCIYADFLMLSE